ncbi:MAG: hypothetical protein KO206_05035 [Methanomicrobiaceae archaeon]|nr:hypothetical protein [Methanomicrobiaceae archaeon]MDD5418981.1 hypothetical protein [Methanomicrobiaceae archaeon]
MFEHLRRVVRAAHEQRTPEEQKMIAAAAVRQMLDRFCSDWHAIMTGIEREEWLASADTVIDRHSHQMTDLSNDLFGMLEDDLIGDIRALSAEMIKTANILHMLGSPEEFRVRGAELARRAKALSMKLEAELPLP